MFEFDKARRRRRIGIAVAAIALAGSALVMWNTEGLRVNFRSSDFWFQVLVLTWVVGPSVWFFLEWALLRPSDPDAQREFLATQEAARRVWLALSAALALYYGLK